MPVARLLLAYDGAAFHGFAENPGVITVAGTLRGAIERVARHPVALTGAGRTDAGVHAWGQVVSFPAPPALLDLARVQRSVNRLCAPALVIRSASWAPDGFDARFSARWRRYRYTVLNRETPDPFLARTAWHVVDPLELDLLRLASDAFVGEHDFSSFCRRPKGPPGEAASLVRRVLEAHWEPIGPDGLLRFEIRANAFCHNMVRSIVGTLVEVGRGRCSPGEMRTILRSCDRSAAGPVAPAHGLCLWEVGYPPATESS
ncbi:MAG: tRNA pseudouridine(38-40) synthase TruA [Acidimicrobiales bacterium]